MNYALPLELEEIHLPKKEINIWLKENIPEMKANRFINVWRKIHSLNLEKNELVNLKDYLEKEVKKNKAYNYYFIMYLLDNFKNLERVG